MNVYTISHREQGQWIWDGNADQDGATTANLPEDVYAEMPLAAGETRHEFTANDGTRYLIERV